MRLINWLVVLALVTTVVVGCQPNPDARDTQTALQRNPALGTSVDAGVPVFQAVTSPDGKLFRLNTRTGQMHLVTTDGLLELTDAIKVLRIGEYYKMADVTK